MRAELFASIVVGLIAAAPAAAAAQQPSTIQSRLMRISTDLASGSPHVDDNIREAKAILAIDPHIAEAHLLLAMSYRAGGRPDMLAEAKAELEQALDLKPDLLTARFLLAQTYFDLGRFERARDELNAGLERAPGQPQLLTLLADTERRLAQPQRAADLARQALQADASSMQARYYLGLALLDLRRPDEGIRELETVVRSGVPLPEVYAALASAYLDAKRLDEAAATSEAGLRLDPRMAHLRLLVARAYRLKGALPQAEAHLAQVEASASSIQPTADYQHQEAALHVEWGELRLAQGQLGPAATALNHALSVDPQSGPAHRALTRVLARQGQYARALEHAAKAEALGAPLPAEERKAIASKVPGRGRGGAQ